MMRYNMFNLKHKGLRAMLYHNAMVLQHTNFENQEAAGDAIKQLQVLLTDFHDHAEHEDKFVLPAIAAHSPGLVAQFEAEHKTDEELTREITEMIASYMQCRDDESRALAGYKIVMAFNSFIAFNLNHMNKEEEEINKVLWQHYDDVELLGISQAIVASIPPDNLAGEAKWMIRGSSNPEIINWLRAVKNTAPPSAFEMLMQVAESSLSSTRWNEVKEGLTDGVMVA